jgi:hypothetical protein
MMWNVCHLLKRILVWQIWRQISCIAARENLNRNVSAHSFHNCKLCYSLLLTALRKEQKSYYTVTSTIDRRTSIVWTYIMWPWLLVHNAVVLPLTTDHWSSCRPFPRVLWRHVWRQLWPCDVGELRHICDVVQTCTLSTRHSTQSINPILLSPTL